jgi:hypothetical protein
VLDQQDWLGRLHLSRRDVGTGMSLEECADFNTQVDLAGLRAYWDAVGQRTRRVAAVLDPEEFEVVVDPARFAHLLASGILGNERAGWVEQFFAGRTTAWWLAYVLWHHTEHLFGEALCVRSQAGIALGL